MAKGDLKLIEFDIYTNRILNLSPLLFLYSIPNSFLSLFIYLFIILFALCFCVYIFRAFSFKVISDSQGTSQLSSMLKSSYDKARHILCCQTLPSNYKRLETKLERKMMEINKNATGSSTFKSIDSIIMKFPQIREGLMQIREVFEQYDEDSTGTIDKDELKKFLHSLEFGVRDEEINDLFHYCDMDENEDIQFNEFIVLLCLIYLLTDSSSSSHQKLKMSWPRIEATFNTIIEVFLFLDKNGDGKLNRKDVVKALNQSSPKEKSPSHITRTRFKEMDWDKNGKISFKEFLFSFMNWVGIDCDDEGHEK